VPLRRFGSDAINFYTGRNRSRIGVGSFIGGVLLLDGASNADAARVLSGAAFCIPRRDNDVSDRKVQDEMEAALQTYRER